jgi:hypothetical protein
VAEAQARAIVDILASYATAGSQDREILLAVDEFSAVSRPAGWPDGGHGQAGVPFRPFLLAGICGPGSVRDARHGSPCGS